MADMAYSEFEIRFLLALVDAAEAGEHEGCEAFQVAQSMSPEIKEQWVRDAVRSYEQRGYLGNVSRALRGTIGLTISGEGRKAVESLRAQIAVAQQPRPKIGF